jgi:mannose-6-phosphate isomerase-like protein (cupin superfamily)
MEDRLKLSLAFDPARLKRDLDRLEAGRWTQHFVKQNYEGDWSVVALRASATAKHPVMMIYSDPSCDEFVDTPLLRETPYFQEVLGAFRCRLDAARLMKLTPGSVIKEHRDHDLAFEEGKFRIHVPVQTNPEVEFHLNGRRVILAAGECWYLRLSDPHRVANRGTTDRVHLVIDGRVNGWVEELFAQAPREV